jgi:ribosomal protein S6--L-glutamate ligase
MESMVALQALVVIGRSYDANNKELYSTCRKLIGKTFLARASDLSAYVSSRGSRFWTGYTEMRDIDVCFFRSFGAGRYEQIIKRFGLMKHLESTGTTVVNSTEALQNIRDKYSMVTALFTAGLPIPETYVTESAHWAYRKIRTFKEAVYKPISGSLGFGAMKFKDADMAFNAYKILEALGLPLYLQQYLENVKRDIRAFVIGERVVASISRVASKGNWRANIALGSKPKLVKPSKQSEEMALKASEALGVIYAGVDILETIDGPVLLEVNGSPSWQGVRNASDIEIAELLVKHVLGLIKR